MFFTTTFCESQKLSFALRWRLSTGTVIQVCLGNFKEIVGKINIYLFRNILVHFKINLKKPYFQLFDFKNVKIFE